MPTYEYECTKCGHRFEAFQQMSAKPLDTCPACGKKAKRLISSGVGFIFKGAGFYATDYAKKQPAPPGPAAGCPAAKEGCNGCKAH